MSKREKWELFVLILFLSSLPFQLEELPQAFNKLTGLKSLDLFNNKLTEIPEALNYFKKLVRLDLSEVMTSVWWGFLKWQVH